ncbi:hypothetical protein RQP46_006598 [Phenoliferia psychrophenolica]
MDTIEKWLPTLPTETWIEILTEHGLSYHDLKRVAGVSRAFKTIIESRPLDALLFRGEPQATLPVGTEVLLHPVLLDGWDFIPKRRRDFEISNKSYDKFWRICDLACADDFATSPPVSSIDLQNFGRKGHYIKMKKSTGFRVVDVLDCIQNCRNKPLNGDEQSQIEREFYSMWGRDEDDPRPLEAQEINEMESYYEFSKDLGENDCDWGGWEPVVVNEGGVVVLKPKPGKP